MTVCPVWSESSLCTLWVAKDPSFFMQTAKTLIRLGGCPGWSESSLGAHAILLVLSWGGSYPFATSFSSLMSHTYLVHFSSLCEICRVVNSLRSWHDFLSAHEEVVRVGPFHVVSVWHCVEGSYWQGKLVKHEEVCVILENKMSRDMTKPTKWVCAQQTQINLGIHPVWSGSLLSAWRKLRSLATH